MGASAEAASPCSSASPMRNPDRNASFSLSPRRRQAWPSEAKRLFVSSAPPAPLRVTRTLGSSDSFDQVIPHPRHAVAGDAAEEEEAPLFVGDELERVGLSGQEAGHEPDRQGAGK